MPESASSSPLPRRDPDTELEILGYRDAILGQKVTIANLEWRLRDTERRLKETTRQRNDMLRSATWRIGRLAMAVLWPVRRARAILFPPELRKRKTKSDKR